LGEVQNVEVVISLDLNKRKQERFRNFTITEAHNMLGERKQPTERVLR
jgi:hypothetical protein